VYYTDFGDDITDKAYEVSIIYTANNLEGYRRRMEQYLEEKKQHIIINKLRQNIPITSAEVDELERMLFEQDTLGTKEDFEKAYGKQPLGKFIRSILGLDIHAAKLVFGTLLNSQKFNSSQIRFIDTIINYLNVNGMIEPARLFDAPFTDINAQGMMGLFDEVTSTQIISLIEEVNHGADVG